MNDAGFILQYDDVSVFYSSDSPDTSSDPVEENSESESGQRDSDVGDDNNTSIDSDLRDGEISDVDLSTIENNQVFLIQQIDNLNNNLVTFQQDNKTTIGLLFAVIVVLMVQIVFKLFYKILGFGQM